MGFIQSCRELLPVEVPDEEALHGAGPRLLQGDVHMLGSVAA